MASPVAPAPAPIRPDIARQLAETDLTRPDLVVWAPGLGGSGMDDAIPPAIAARPDASRFATLGLDVTALGQTFTDHVAQQVSGLRDLVRGVRELRGADAPRILLAGHSAGAQAIAEVLRDPDMLAAVAGAALLGKPGFGQPMSAAAEASGKVRSWTSSTDPVARPVADPAAVTAAVDVYASDVDLILNDDDSAVQRHPAVLAARQRDPEGIANLETWITRSDGPDPHRYDARYPEAIEFLGHIGR